MVIIIYKLMSNIKSIMTKIMDLKINKINFSLTFFWVLKIKCLDKIEWPAQLARIATVCLLFQ